MWASSPHLRSKFYWYPICNLFSLLQSHIFLNFPVRIWKIREKQRQKFKQGNGAIAARWQAKSRGRTPFCRTGSDRFPRRAFSHCFLYCLKNILHEKIPTHPTHTVKELNRHLMNRIFCQNSETALERNRDTSS